MLRYFATKVIPLAALFNVAINFFVGRAIYPAGIVVPFAGDKSVTGDTLVGAFLIGFFTLLAVTPAARQEARAGRVPGRGRGARWLGFVARHPFVSAIGFGIVSLLVLGAPVVALLVRAGSRPMAREAFITFKTAFAGAAGVITAIAAAWIGIAPEPDVSGDPRWCHDPSLPTGGRDYPCDYIDKGGLAVSSRAHGCSGTPTWQLVVRGALDPAHLRIALADLVTRYPSLATRVQSLDGAPPHAKRFRYAHDAAFRAERLLEVVDLRGDPARLEAVVHEAENRYLDLYTDPPISLTLVMLGDDACRLLFRQHHAIADGRAFIGLLADFAVFLDAARAGRRPDAAALAPIDRRSELDALGLGRLARAATTAAGYRWLGAAILRSIFTPVTPLSQNRSNDYTGDDGAVRWIVPDDALVAWNAARKRIGASLNSLLTGALFVANQRWHRARSLPVGRTIATLLLETRPRSSSFVSFANHLAMIEVALPLHRLDDPAAIVRRVQAEVDRQRRARAPEKRLLCERQLVSTMTVAQMQRFVFESKRPAFNLNFSNLIALEFPTIGGAGWQVDEVLITTPVGPRTGIALTAIRYNGRLVFNFNYKSSAATRAETEELCRHFAAAVAELTSPAR